MKKPFYFLISIFLLSCQAGHELHYFKQGKNYFRISVDEKAFLSSSRYTSGYYDEDAVDKYFGEIHRPDSTGRIIPLKKTSTSTDSSAHQSDNENKKTESVQESLQNTKLVLILSTDATAVADQIGSLAENEQTLETIARLTHKGTIDQNNKLKGDLQLIDQKNKSIAQMGDAFIGGITIDSTGNARSQQNKVKTSLLAFINSLASTMGHKVPFANLTEAQQWYYNNF
jgi:hypothetical protein